MPKKEEGSGEGTLVVFLQALVGQRVKVDLRTEVQLAGRLDGVDNDMTLRMSTLICTSPEGERTRKDRLLVPGKQVRYVHIPDSVDISKTMNKYTSAAEKSREAFSSQHKKAPT
jgi:small nuclear ribonucleoprotein (snRNP)-like protein